MSITGVNPVHVANALVRSEVEVLRARDPELSAALEVSPPEVKRVEPRDRRPEVPPLPPGLYGYARRGYRFLNRFGPLQPLLRRVRARVEQFQTAKTVHGRNTTVRQHQGKARHDLLLPRLSRTYTIAFTMRSGSNEICNLLARNGLGVPNEFFQQPLAGGSPGLLLSSFGRIVSRYESGGIFGSKMSHEHRVILDEQLREAIPGYRQIHDVLPAHRWVWLQRRDKILQAISWCRAESSRRWATGDSRRETRSENFEYDYFYIMSRIMLIHASELAWECYFRERRIQPLILIYEDFFQHLDDQLSSLIQHLGGLPSGRTALDKATTYAVQRNDESYAIRQRFMSDLCRIGEQSMEKDLGEPYQRWTRFFLESGWKA